MIARTLILAIAIAAFLPAASAARPGDDRAVAITNVTVIPLDRERVIRNATVIVKGGKITGVSRKAEVPKAAAVIDGTGKYLIPGLADMHAHLFSDGQFPDALAEDELKIMIANGVTTVRFMIGTPEHLLLREKSRKGEIVAPAIYAASPQLAGRSFGDPFNGYAVTNASEARDAVRKAKASGYDFIKLTFFITREVFDAVVDEAAKQNIRVIGHVDRQVGLKAALDAGQQIEHLDGYFEAMIPEGSGLEGSTSGVFVWRPQAWESLDVLDERKIPELANLTVAKSPFSCPTLTFLKLAFGVGQSDEDIRSHPDYRFLPDSIREEMAVPRDRFWSSPPSSDRRRKYVDYRNRFVKAIHDAGGKIMAGSDAPEWFLLYGFTLHRELESLSEAGLSNYDVLVAATRNPAEFLRELDVAGTIAPGKRADLVMLDADPLKDISNTTRIAGVMLKGKWLDRAALQRMLDEAEPKFRSAFNRKTN